MRGRTATVNLKRGFRRLAIVLSGGLLVVALAADAWLMPPLSAGVRVTLTGGRELTLEHMPEVRPGMTVREAIATALSLSPLPPRDSFIPDSPPPDYPRTKVEASRPSTGIAALERDLAEMDRAARLRAFRQKYPQYNDMTDDALAWALAAKFPEYRGLVANLPPGFVPVPDERSALLDKVRAADIRDVTVMRAGLTPRFAWWWAHAGFSRLAIAVAALLWLSFFAALWIARGFA
jgi:hypothetical protein